MIAPKSSKNSLPINRNIAANQVFVVIQEKAVYHDLNSAAPHYSKTIIGIYFDKKEAHDKKRNLILSTCEDSKYSYVYIEPHEIV